LFLIFLTIIELLINFLTFSFFCQTLPVLSECYTHCVVVNDPRISVPVSASYRVGYLANHLRQLFFFLTRHVNRRVFLS